MHLSRCRHGRPRQSPEWFSSKDKKAQPLPCLKADTPAENGRPDRRSLTRNVSANLFRFTFVLYGPVLLVDVVNVLVCVQAGGPFPVRLGKLRPFRRSAAYVKCGDSRFGGG